MAAFALAVGFGIVTASVLALAAVGVTLQFGVTNYVNFAYGAYMTLAAYLAWQFNVVLNLNFVLSVGLACVAISMIAVALNRAILQPFSRRSPPPVVMFIVTLGIWLFVSNLITVVWGPDPHEFNAGGNTPLHLGPFLFTPQQIAVTLIAVLLMFAIHLMLSRTKLGKAMRATSDDPGLARVSGINTDAIITLTWLIVGVLIGLSGCVLALTIASFDPTMGDAFLFVIFSAVILGGIGQPYGAMLGALIIGLVTEISALAIPIYKDDVAFAVLILMLLIRPQGLIPARGRQ
jgi:branched-subunit amino acid ABC-type transport system permease component